MEKQQECHHGRFIGKHAGHQATFALALRYHEQGSQGNQRNHRRGEMDGDINGKSIFQN